MESYLEDLREEASADLLHIKIVQSVQRGDRVPQRLTGSARPPLRARILMRITGAHVQVANIALHFGGPPRVTALLPVIPRRGQLQLRRKILGQTGNAALLQRVTVRLHPILGRCRGGKISPAVSLLAGGGSCRDDHVHDVHVLTRVVLGLLAGLVGRLDHRNGGVVHRRVGSLVVGIGGPMARIGRPAARLGPSCNLADLPLRNRLSRQMLLLTGEKLAVQTTVFLHQLRGIPRATHTAVHVQIAQAGGTQYPLRLRGRRAVVGFRQVDAIRVRRALVAGQALQPPVACLLRVFGAVLGDRAAGRLGSAHLGLGRKVGLVVHGEVALGRRAHLPASPHFRFILGRGWLVGGLLGPPAFRPVLGTLVRGTRSFLRPLRLRLVVRDARRLRHRGSVATLLGSPQLLLILDPRGRRLRDHRGHVFLGPPRLRLLVAEDGWGLVHRETRQASGGRRPGARFRRSIVRRRWPWCVRGWHLAEHFRRYCGKIEQLESGRKVAASARRITRIGISLVAGLSVSRARILLHSKERGHSTRKTLEATSCVLGAVARHLRDDQVQGVRSQARECARDHI